MLYGQYPCVFLHPLQPLADCLPSPNHPPRVEAISQAREVQVQAEGGGIPWIDHLERPHCYGSDESPQSHGGVANPNEDQGGPVLPWLCELLSEVYPQLL